MYNFCHDKIVYWIDNIVEGTLSYKDYEKELESANKDLEKMKSPFMFVLIGREEIDDELFMEDPGTWIAPVFHDTETKEDEEKLNATGFKK